MHELSLPEPMLSLSMLILANIDQNQPKICQNQPKSPKVNMLKFGDVSFDLGFEW